MAKEIEATRPGSRVLGIGNVDVRRTEELEDAAAKCVGELGGIDFVMYVECLLGLWRLVIKLQLTMQQSRRSRQLSRPVSTALYQRFPSCS